MECGRIGFSEAYNDQLGTKRRACFRRREPAAVAEQLVNLSPSQFHMSNFIHDALNGPGEYWPFLALLAAVLLFWAALCASGFVSLRAGSRRRKFWFALFPLLLGLPCVLGSSPVSIETQGFRLNV
jgi:hypothetical protein